MNHIKTKKHQQKDDSKIEAEKFVKEISQKIDDNVGPGHLNSSSQNLRIEMKRAQLKSYSPRSTIAIFSGIVNRNSKAGIIDNISDISDYKPFIHEVEIDRLVKLFLGLMDDITIIQDSAFLHDEHFGICTRGMDEDGLWVQQKLISIWSIDHHLSGLNMTFIGEKSYRGYREKSFSGSHVYR